MKQGTIRISASVDYDGDCTFDVLISKGTIETHIHFYGDVDTWKSFGKQLIDFPQDISDYVVFDARTTGFYIDSLLLKAYCYDAQGHAAIKILTDNNYPDPDQCRLDFAILTEVASINQLGLLLLNWQVENNSEIIWQAQIS
ncbi:hypothetical protein [Hymenobacter sp. HDW8]|uniref:hypothetical protein n=1 Tax=Hymenobacter sp. HDW8 TaxID=2714932 RepID=UPI00140D2CB6|nr:hypothetical protein [Hymenobacter sp. HDW8]QIL75718.1 hypothetical protein G7064_07540 [Hymenobacter sp. HDW8]